MRHRGLIYVAGALAPFAVAVGLVPSAGAKGGKPKGHASPCTVFVTTEVPSNETVVLPSAAQGQQWGSIACGGKTLGSGAQKQDFASPDTGDTSGTFTSYFRTGTVHGTFKLTQQEGSITTSNDFASANYVGTLKITGGSGTFKDAKGTGTLTCTTPDGIHFTYKEKIALK
jgi:hypothetical protein